MARQLQHRCTESSDPFSFMQDHLLNPLFILGPAVLHLSFLHDSFRYSACNSKNADSPHGCNFFTSRYETQEPKTSGSQMWRLISSFSQLPLWIQC